MVVSLSRDLTSKCKIQLNWSLKKVLNCIRNFPRVHACAFAYTRCSFCIIRCTHSKINIGFSYWIPMVLLLSLGMGKKKKAKVGFHLFISLVPASRNLQTYWVIFLNLLKFGFQELQVLVYALDFLLISFVCLMQMGLIQYMLFLSFFDLASWIFWSSSVCEVDAPNWVNSSIQSKDLLALTYIYIYTNIGRVQLY